MLRDRSVRKVYQCGRRCLPGWIKIFNPITGEMSSIESLYSIGKTSVATMNNEYKIQIENDCPISFNGKKSVYRLTLKGGKQIDATDNHPFFTAEGWKELKNLQVGEMLATPSKLDFFGNESIDINDIKLLAYMIGDGNCKNKNIRFTQIPNSAQHLEMEQIVKNYDCELFQYPSIKRQYDFIIRKNKFRHNRTYPNKVKNLLIQYDVYNRNADNKIIPKKIFQLKKEQIALFLSRLFATDGWALSSYRNQKWLCEIGYASNSEMLIREISHLLLRFGIKSNISKKTQKAWNLGIYDKKSINIFAQEIGIYGKEKALQKVVDDVNKKLDLDSFMPKVINKEIISTMKSKQVTKADLVRLWEDTTKQNSRLRLEKYKLQKQRAKLIAKYLDMQDLSLLIDGDIEWQEIKSIKYIGDFDTYDLTVSNTHNFIANDIITHNTGKTETMIVEGLHKVCTNKNFRILYVTPYENQVNLIFMRMREIIQDSPLIKNDVVRMKNSPYMIEFKNGSTIMGFTTGASSGQGAASIRGQRADWIFLDEIDYMAENDFSTVAMIAGERSDIGITASSTPTGKRGTFYRMCTDKSFGYSHHYHPSMHNPNWNQQMEDQFRAELTQSQYDHEILAIFGTEEAGVFDKNKLDKALTFKYYTYDKLTENDKRKIELSGGNYPDEYIYDRNNLPPYNPFRCMGVDFDKYQASSSIIILDFDVDIRKFKVIKRIEVPRGEYTLDNAVKMIIELNDIYKPSWIYVDRGYGDYQLERLHIYGDEHPSSGLKNKVKGWQFKNTIEIIDPVTKEKTKEPMKPFMVNQLSVSFDRERIVLSPFDIILHKQLVDYAVERVSQSGIPIYSSKNEHYVDALGLAHLGFVLEFPQLSSLIKKPKFTTKIKHSVASLGANRVKNAFKSISQPIKNPWKNYNTHNKNDDNDLPGDKPYWTKAPKINSNSQRYKTAKWGNRTGVGFKGRSLW